MNIDFELDQHHAFYDRETARALEWLLEIRDKEQKGWAWVQFIQPNEQNTAEVISAFVDYIDHFDEQEICAIVESIKKWLLDTSHAMISIDFCWVMLALQKVRGCKLLADRIDLAKLNEAIDNCIAWLCKNQNNEKMRSVTQLCNSPGVKGCGWGDNDTEISGTIRTSLAVLALNREIAFLSARAQERGLSDEEAEAIQKKLKRLTNVSSVATEWLLSIQNADGGWGNLDKKSINSTYEADHSFSYSDLLYQCESNAACTGYAMLALNSTPAKSYLPKLNKAASFLRNSQKENGGWPIFSEIGVRNGKRYTFRHFSTAWALQGLVASDTAAFNDECVIKGFSYLSSLQDENYGGWKSSSNADNYTWATCNALATIRLLKKSLSEVESKQFLKIVCEWWDMKKKDCNYHFKLGKTIFAFNAKTCLSFCIVFSGMFTLLLFLIYMLLDPILSESKMLSSEMIYSVLAIATAIIIGLPWIVYVKNIFHREQEGWLDSIGWVYGIITGFVLVLYQFII